MEGNGKNRIEHLLPGYFSGEIKEEDRKKVDKWKNDSEENNKFFRRMASVWKSGEILNQMQQFDASKALKKINERIKLHTPSPIWQKLQKIAAILLIPVLIYSGFLTFRQLKNSGLYSENQEWQTVRTSAGMQSDLKLPDGTHVWLNSETVLKYPLHFENYRKVLIKGEAFFEVKKDQHHPFLVKTGKMNIEVMGTSFNVTNYPSENQTEVVLKSGKVKLFAESHPDKRGIRYLVPNQRAAYNNKNNQLIIDNVCVEKYTAWKDGILMFVNDPMPEVTKKLSRWFNVDIVLEDNELEDYIYKATFKDESLAQVLELLKLSAPIEYTVKPRGPLPDGRYSKKKVIIRKRKI